MNHGQKKIALSKSLDLLPVSIMLIRKDGIVVDWNKRSEEIFELKKRDVIGKKIMQFFSEEERDRLQQFITTMISTQERKLFPVFERCNGAKIQYLELRPSKEEIDGYKDIIMMLAIDITERRKYEEQQDFFIGLASHELKTPLASIKAFTQMLMRKFEKIGDTATSTYMSKIDGKVDTLTKLINELLDITRIRAGKLEFNDEVFYFDDLVSEVTDSLQPTLSTHKINVKGKTKKLIIADKSRLEQVMINIIRNAYKYSPEAKKIDIRLISDKRSVTFTVTDFGVGIPPEDVGKIFRPFYRSERFKSTTDGLGLGLYISSEIIIHYGGSIDVQSKLGKGTTFIITLPLRHK